MTKWSFRLLIVVLTAIAVAFQAALVQPLTDRHRAEALLRTMRTFRIGITTTQQAQAALAPYAHHLVTGDVPAETTEPRLDNFVFHNLDLARLGLARGKLVSMQVDYELGKVSGKSVHYMEEPNRGALLVEQLRSGIPICRLGTGRQIGAFRTGEPNYVLCMYDDDSVPEARRDLDWNFDLSCLTTIGSCGNFHAIFPGVFQ